MKTLKGKVAVVTGAASGIGQSVALSFAKEGCHLALVDLDSDGLSETKGLAEKFGVKVTTDKVDVANYEEMLRFSKTVLEAHQKVNILVNNAGVALTGTIMDASMEDFEWLLGVNFWGVVNGCKAFIPLLKESGEGHIVNVSSIGGFVSSAFMGPYCASKYAVRGYTEALYQELIDTCIGVTCVHPGGVRTNLAQNSKAHEKYSSVIAESAALVETKLKTPPSLVADRIISAIKKNKLRLIVGRDAHLVYFLARWLPGLFHSRALVNRQKKNIFKPLYEVKEKAEASGL